MVNLPSEYDKYIFEILLILEDKVEPIGSGLLSQHLQEKGYELSEATVGRVLSSMDRQKLTQKIQFQGRVISDEGRKKLDKLRNQHQRETYGNRFIETLESRNKEDIIEILVARKAIERELARLAAINATEADILKMEEVLLEHQKYTVEQKLSEEHDIKFHKLLGLSAKNKVLTAALDLIRHDERLSPILDYIRREEGEKLTLDHSEIVQAIKQHDPEQAEQAMVNHVQSLIEDISKFWNKKFKLKNK